jgi:ubiquinone/menaquinone biosynthesis C-methylase UbiE
LDIKERWNELHRQPRFCPIYPSDRVVAWTFRMFARSRGGEFRILDLGSGAGRHAIFLAREGYQSFACDFSSAGIEELKRRAEEDQLHVETEVCEADALKYPDGFFDAVICYGVLYYLPYKRYQKAVKEIQRVLKPSGKAFIVTRSCGDSRFDHAKKTGEHDYVLVSLDENAPSDAEVGMTETFLTEGQVQELFAAWKLLSIDRLLVSYRNQAFRDDDWIIEATK